MVMNRTNESAELLEARREGCNRFQSGSRGAQCAELGSWRPSAGVRASPSSSLPGSRGRDAAGWSPVRIAFVTALAVLLCFASATAGERLVLYETGFEVSEGYADAEEGLPLWDQGMGWWAEGSGGSGLLFDFFPDLGQQAYLGYAPPAFKDEVLSVWRPVDSAAPPPGYSVLQFSVLMQIRDSENHRYDDFRWSVYNTESQRLFTLDFDNARAEIFYLLDDNQTFRPSGFGFDNDTIYLLEVWMNFARNNWLAIMNGQVVVDSQPITTTGARLDFSDADAVWALREKGNAGDNYLLFDEYRVTAEPTPTIPPVLEIIGRYPTGEFELWLHGERGLSYAIDVTDEYYTEWYPLQTNAPPDGLWRFVDESAPDFPVSFYRARQVYP